MTTTTRNRTRARAGAALIAASLAMALLAVPTGGVAQEEPEAEQVTVAKDALYARSAGQAAPNTVTSEFPPGVICLVVVEFCTEQAQDATQPVEDALTGADLDDDGEDDTPPAEDTPDDESPQQFRAPNTVTVAQNSGEDRYAGALQFELPAISEDEEVVSATLVLTEVQPTYHTSSPFFRQMMLAALAGVRDQEAAQEEATKAIMDPGTYPPGEAEVGEVGVEICPFTEAFSEGAHNWDDTPAFDCIFGANGVRVETETGYEWHFDLGFTLQAWNDGTLANNGLYIRPTKAPNLAFGDPDTSWQAQISFGSKEHPTAPPRLAVETAEASSPTPFVPPPSNTTDSSSGSSGSSTQGSVFPPPQAFPSSDAPAPAPAPVGEPGPAVAQPQPAPQPVANQQLASSPVTPWWVWLLVPTFVLGAFMLSQALTAEAQAAVVREGAMTRLVRQRNAGELATGTPQFQV